MGIGVSRVMLETKVGGVLFSSAARATYDHFPFPLFPFEARGFRYLEELVAETKKGERGGGSYCLERNQRSHRDR